MNNRTKSSLIFVTTFLSGIVVGFVLNGVLVRNHFHREVRRMRSFGGFHHRFEEIVQPTPEQRQAMRQILKIHFEEINRLREEMPAKLDSLRIQLERVLTPEQIERLKKSHLFRSRPPGPPGEDKPFPHLRREPPSGHGRPDSMRYRP